MYMKQPLRIQQGEKERARSEKRSHFDMQYINTSLGNYRIFRLLNVQPIGITVSNHYISINILVVQYIEL